MEKHFVDLKNGVVAKIITRLAPTDEQKKEIDSLLRNDHYENYPNVYCNIEVVKITFLQESYESQAFELDGSAYQILFKEVARLKMAKVVSLEKFLD